MAQPEKVNDIINSIWRMLQRFWPYVRKQRMLAAGSMLALLAEIGLRILEPWPLKFVFDRVLTPSGFGGTNLPFVDSLAPMQLLILASVVIVLTIGLRSVASYYNKVGFALVGNSVLTRVRSDLYAHLQRLSLSFHTKAKSGDLIVRVIGDVTRLKEVAVTAMLPLFGNIMVLFGMLGVMFWLHWRLTLIAISVFPVFWFFTIRLGQKIRQVSRKQRKRESAMAATASESFGAMKIIQAMSLEHVFDHSFSSQNQKSLKEGVKAKRLSANLERSVDVLVAIATALVVLYGARLVMSHALTPGDLLVFLAYLKSAFKPLKNYAKYMARLAKASAAGDRVLEVLDTVPDVRDLPNAVSAPAFKGAISFESVAFNYQDGQLVLHDINFETKPGEWIAIVGPSGHGKSTLVSHIMRLYDPVKGRVMIDNHDIRDFTLNSLRSQISTVLQDTLLFGTSVHENIAYGSTDASVEDIKMAARLANAHEFIMAMPEGYQTELGERGVTLSNGQRQRIAIARAAVRKSPILILDEPTTGLDEENQKEVAEALERLAEGRTTFLIVHNLEFASKANRILYLEHGRICEQGSHPELMEADGKYAALFRLQNSQPKIDNQKRKKVLLEPERDLIKRDVNLPGLSTLLDSNAFIEALKPFVPETELRGAQATYIRYKPGMNCLVAYKLDTSAGNLSVYAKAYGNNAKVKLNKAASPKCAPGPLGLGRITLDHIGVVVSFFPNDSSLKRLRRLSENEVQHHLFNKFLQDAPDRHLATMEPIAYKPERRYVARLSTPSGAKALLKFYTPRTLLTTHQCAQAFESRGQLKVPQFLGKSNRCSVLAFEWLEGKLLSDLIYIDRNGTTKAVKETGAALAELHSQEPDGLDTKTREMEISSILALANWLGFVYPPLGRRVRRLAQQLIAWLQSEPSVQRPVHGDFYAKQVLWSEDQVRIVDLDEAARSDPRADLSLFVAHLERDVVRGNIPAGIVPELTAALFEGYMEAGGQCALSGIEPYIAVELFQLLHGPFRKCEPEWPERTEALLDRIEGILNKSKINGQTVATSTNNRTAKSRVITTVNDLFNVKNDAKMPFLKRALDPEEAALLLPRMLQTKPSLASSPDLEKIHVVRYKPGRRCLIEYTLASESSDSDIRKMTLLGKARARGLDTTTYRVCEALWDNGFDVQNPEGISIPQPVGTVPEFNMWFQHKSDGVPATERLLQPGGVELAARISEAIHRIHRADVPTYRRHSMTDELRILHERLSTVAALNPQWKSRLLRILDACDILGSSVTPAQPVGIHRDFYPDHVLLDGERLFIIDFDLYCMGDPSLDIGNFNGHLIEQSLRTFRDPDALREQVEALKERFLRISGARFSKNIQVYTTLTLVRHIYISTLFPDRKPFTESMIDLCERRLGRKSRSNGTMRINTLNLEAG